MAKKVFVSLIGVLAFSAALVGPSSAFAATVPQASSVSPTASTTAKPTSQFTPSPIGQTFVMTFKVAQNGAVTPQNVISGNAGDSWAWLYDTSNPTTMKMEIGASALSGWEWQNMSWNWQISYLYNRTYHESYSGYGSNGAVFSATWNHVKDLYGVPAGNYELTAQLTGLEFNILDPELALQATGNPYDYFTFN